MAIGKIVNLFLKKHLEEAGKDYKTFLESPDGTLKGELKDAIHHAQLMLVCMSGDKKDFNGEGFRVREWCVEHSPVNKTLGDMIAISIELDKVIEENYSIDKFTSYLNRELGWLYEG